MPRFKYVTSDPHRPAPGDYYNTSQEAGFLNPHGVPYGFFPSPVSLAGLGEGGYPVLFDSALTQDRMRTLLTALQQGGYLDAALTDRYAVRVGYQ